MDVEKLRSTSTPLFEPYLPSFPINLLPSHISSGTTTSTPEATRKNGARPLPRNPAQLYHPPPPPEGKDYGTSTPALQVATLSIEGMSCAACVAVIENGISKHVSGIKSTKISLIMEAGVFEFDPTMTSEAELIDTIESFGFEV